MSKSGFTRRQFIILGGTALAGGLLGVSCDENGNILVPVKLLEPEVRTSFAGFLDTVFNISMSPNRLGGLDGGKRINTGVYEGLLPGPTLRVKPGDVMNIRLINNLPPNPDVPPINPLLPHQIYSTNLHTHGLHVSPSGNSDNVLLQIDPGEDFNYSIAIPPNFPGGTHWYHPHKHGSVTTQFQGGMSGAIIVEGALDAVPEVAAARDITVLFQELQLNNKGEVEPPDINTTDIGDVYPADKIYYTVNGQVNPILRARPGEVVRLRFINTTIDAFYPLQLDNHDMYLLANDGISLAEVETMDQVFIEPGSRADVLIQAGEPGIYILRGLEYARSSTIVRDEVNLMTLIVEGEPLSMGLPTILPAPYTNITDDEITGTREIVFDTVTNTGQFPGYDIDLAFTIDGGLYMGDVVNQTVQLGAVEEWTITNNATEDHNFHIHTNPFEVVAIDGEPLDTPVWQDTILLPRNGGSITIRSRFLDFTGALVLHCHILDHEDLGMMQNVEIVS